MGTDRIVIDLNTFAILHIDVQTAFMNAHTYDGMPMPAGGLAVPDGEGILDVVLRDTAKFPDARRYASVDIHPARGHLADVTSYVDVDPFTDITATMVSGWSRAKIATPFLMKDRLVEELRKVRGGRQTVWTKHAPQGSLEANIHEALQPFRFKRIVYKGLDLYRDSYSAVSDNTGATTGLSEEMRDDGVRDVVLDGNCFTHCVGYTGLDLLERGFRVYVVKNGTRNVPIPGLEEDMTRLLEKAGAMIIDDSQLVAPVATK